jgi:hypothetical protein
MLTAKSVEAKNKARLERLIVKDPADSKKSYLARLTGTTGRPGKALERDVA